MGDERFIDDEDGYYERIREETARDKTRSRKPPKWEQPVVIATWPCRNVDCRKPVDLTPEGGDMFALFNKVLRDRGEPPMETGRVLICPDCRKIAERNREQKSRERRRETADIVRQLKNHSNPDSATALHGELERLGHPDVKGLIETLKAKQGSKRRVSKDDV